MYTVILPAAGTGSRMELGYNKLFYKIAGKSIIKHTVDHFLNDSKCKQIIIVTSAADQAQMQALFPTKPQIEFVVGGANRQASVYAALAHVREDVVMIHDGARPIVAPQQIDQCYQLARNGYGAVTAVKPKDTIKTAYFVNDNYFVNKTLNRDELILIQTPQAFPTNVLKTANERAFSADSLDHATDDASLVELHTETDIVIVPGKYQNQKFTTPDDILYFEFLLTKGVL